MTEEYNNQDAQNENQEQNNTNIDKLKSSNNNILKYILILVVVFIATFAAVYTVVDMSMHRLGFTPFEVAFRQAEQIFNDEAKFVEKNSPAPVKIVVKDDKYVVTVDLKMFDNNPENVTVETSNNGIKINGKVKTEKKGETKESSFYQNVIFPQEIDNDKVTKEIKGNRQIIILPFDKD